LGKPLLVLRENTERPEAIKAGIAILVGDKLDELLEENYNNEAWINSVKSVENPFGKGDSAKKIVEILLENFNAKTRQAK
jgi:UDP-N-acetylglucosamine 2-epimerase (non-hydrolysing)